MTAQGADGNAYGSVVRASVATGARPDLRTYLPIAHPGALVDPVGRRQAGDGKTRISIPPPNSLIVAPHPVRAHDIANNRIPLLCPESLAVLQGLRYNSNRYKFVLLFYGFRVTNPVGQSSDVQGLFKMYQDFMFDNYTNEVTYHSLIPPFRVLSSG